MVPAAILHDAEAIAGQVTLAGLLKAWRDDWIPRMFHDVPFNGLV
jgi:hypothetical protein